MIHYFAYGSNLHPIRLTERVPSARLIGVSSLDNHSLEFHKKGKDGSGKCDLFRTGTGSDSVYGAIYELDHDHIEILDDIEGKGVGYLGGQVSLSHEGCEYSCFTYHASESHIIDDLKPFHWYKDLVVLGASYLKLPESYIASIKSIDSIDDHHDARREEHTALIQKVKEYI